MHTIAEALNKIINFVGDKRQVDEQDIRNVVTQNTYDSIFDLTEAIGKRSVKQALKSLHDVLSSGQEPNSCQCHDSSPIPIRAPSQVDCLRRRNFAPSVAGCRLKVL